MAGSRKKLTPSQLKERDDLEGVLACFFEHFWGMDEKAADHPVTISRQSAAIHGELRAFSGLKMAINDCLEFGKDLTFAQVREFDIECRRRSVLTMSALRRTYSSKFKALVKRGRIRSETEYHMVNAALSDTTLSDAEEQELLGQMMAAYEGNL